MPRRNVHPSNPDRGQRSIIIGQACEFDYSGAQDAGASGPRVFEVVLINSNPATIHDGYESG